MSDRTPISRRLRFEVFKRDKFTCQYCGATATQKLLHCDHVEPVAEGGETTLLNLITACVDCNLGKGARPLSDDSAMAKQHRQLAELEERRQQLEMMREWREELAQHQVDQIEIVSDAFEAWSQFVPNDQGKLTVRRWLKKYGLAEVLAAIDETFSLYLTSATSEAWEAAFKRIPRMLAIGRQEKTDPHIRKLLYIQAILRNRWEISNLNCVDALRKRLTAGYDIGALEAAAKNIREEHGWKELDASAAAIMKQSVLAAKPPEVKEEEDQPEEPETYERWEAWEEPEWYIRMWADCFRGTTKGHVLEELASWVRFGGVVDDGKITSEDVAILKGFRAVGLIQPISVNGDIFRVDERGNRYPTFQVPPRSPREATEAFNRYGALRLGFWRNTRAFAHVSEVH